MRLAMIDVIFRTHYTPAHRNGRFDLKAKIIEGLAGKKVATELSDCLADLAKSKKTVRFVTQSESTHGRDGANHHVTVTVWYD
jgi:hypothetical protein